MAPRHVRTREATEIRQRNYEIAANVRLGVSARSRGATRGTRRRTPANGSVFHAKTTHPGEIIQDNLANPRGRVPSRVLASNHATAMRSNETRADIGVSNEHAGVLPLRPIMSSERPARPLPGMAAGKTPRPAAPDLAARQRRTRVPDRMLVAHPELHAGESAQLPSSPDSLALDA
jgi:hypothetical protein